MPVQRIIAFDPGVTTGAAVCDLEPDWTEGVPPVDTWHLSEHRNLWATLHEQDPDVIVYEKFFYQRRDKVVLEPVEMIGIIKLYADTTETPIFGLSAQQAKVFWTDDKLKKLGLWETNHKHAMDALRHLLYYLLFEKRINVVEGLRDVPRKDET